MKKIICLLILAIIVSGCGFSLRESYIRSKRPNYLKNYKKGPIFSLSQEDIQEAIEFGKTNKHKQDVINYAFIFTKNVTIPLGPIRQVYILVCTNYYLIADYAAKQTRDYETIDMDYVDFLANLPTFHIEVAEQIQPVGMVGYSFQTENKFVLLKDNVKVEESSENLLYKNKSPYSISHLSGIQSNWQEIADETVRQTIEMANRISEAYQKDMKINLDNIPSLAVTRPSHLYNYKDINLTSKYEIAVIYNDGERRIPIDFSKIK